MPVLLETPQRTESVATKALPPRGAMLLRVLKVLEREQIPCCLLHGYEKFPQVVDGDVDCLIPEEFLPHKLAQVLHNHRDEIGGRIVQWFADGAHFIVLAGREDDGKATLLQLHVTSNYEMGGRILFDADEILASRRQFDSFHVPAADIEFICVLVNRLCKGHFTPEHCRRLCRLFDIDSTQCAKQISRFFKSDGTVMVIDAARSGDWKAVLAAMAHLKQQAISSQATRPAGKRLSRLAGKIGRRVRPRNGFHAVFLGPDGVGKSTVIETFQRNLGDVFLSSTYLTFAPGLLPQKFAAPKPDGPHSLPPRSLTVSFLKAAWWLVCYTIGYALTIRPSLVAGGLVVNHRYLVDAIVDQKRYRYSGPVWLLKWIWAVSPKPDVVFLLDAPPQMIFRRKQEVPFTETARQVEAYRTVISPLPMARIIDASQAPARVAADVEWYVLDRLAQRVAREFSLGVAS